MVWSPRSPTAIATVSARPLPESVNGLPKRPLRRSIARTIRRVAPELVLVTSIQAIRTVPRLLAAIWAWPTTGAVTSVLAGPKPPVSGPNATLRR